MPIINSIQFTDFTQAPDIQSPLPGPKDQSPDALQRLLGPVANDLIRLYQRPHVHLDHVRYLFIYIFIILNEPASTAALVALVAVVCDTPTVHCP